MSKQHANVRSQPFFDRMTITFGHGMVRGTRRTITRNLLCGLGLFCFLTSCDQSSTDRRREALWPPPQPGYQDESAPSPAEIADSGEDLSGIEVAVPSDSSSPEVNPSTPGTTSAEIGGLPPASQPEAAAQGIASENPAMVNTEPAVSPPFDPTANPLSSDPEMESGLVGSDSEASPAHPATPAVNLFEAEPTVESALDVPLNLDSVEANPALAGVKVAWLENLREIPLYRVQRQEVLSILKSELADSESRVLDAKGEVQLQKKQILQCIKAQVAAIVVYPVSSEQIAPELQLAKDAGITVIVYGTDPGESSRTTFVGPSQLEIGANLARFMVEVFNNKSREENRLDVTGRVAIIAGPEWDETSQERLAALRTELAAHPGIVIVHEVHANWNYQEAGLAMSDALRLQEDIDVVLALNDYMAVGAEKTIRESGRRSKIMVIGVDGVAGQNGGVKKILEGNLDATLRHPLWHHTIAESIRAALGKEVKGDLMGQENDLIWITRQNAVQSMGSEVKDDGEGQESSKE